MAVFEYMAKDDAGNEFSGVYMDVESKNSLRMELEKMGYTLVKARREKRSIRKNRHKIKQDGTGKNGLVVEIRVSRSEVNTKWEDCFAF